jgi:hypothetical protein
MLFTQLKQPLYRALLLSFLLSFTVSTNVLAAGTLSNNSALFTHDDSSGGKSVDKIILKAPDVATGSCAVFVDADIVVIKQRFGEARILSQPAAGCNPDKGQCAVTVSWRHAPVGRLYYRIKADWEVKSSGC